MDLVQISQNLSLAYRGSVGYMFLCSLFTIKPLSKGFFFTFHLYFGWTCMCVCGHIQCENMFVYACVLWCACGCQGAPTGISFPFLPCESPGWNSGHKVWWQASFLTGHLVKNRISPLSL